MTYQGHVENGAVVLDDPVTLPNGAKLHIVVVETRDLSNPNPSCTRGTLRKFAGQFTGLPDDGSVNIDHYLYGHPKR